MQSEEGMEITPGLNFDLASRSTRSYAGELLPHLPRGMTYAVPMMPLQKGHMITI